MTNFIHFTAIISTLFSCVSGSIFFTNSASFDEGRFKANWTFHNESDSFYFRIEVEATGWIGFGITELNSSSVWMRDAMHSYDVVVCGVYGNNGSFYALVSLMFLYINMNICQLYTANIRRINHFSEWF